MSIIALIKEPGILREGILKVLQDKLPQHTVAVYGSTQLNLLYKESHIVDLLIIDMDANINIVETIDLYSDLNKKIAVWTSEGSHLIELFKLGLHGYIFNGMTSNELIIAINSMFDGRQYIHPYLSPFLLNDYIRLIGGKINRPHGVLTEREWEVLEQIAKGKSNENIAEILFISSTTVNNHVGSIYKKLHVTDRTNAALLAIKNNWCTL